MSGVGLYLPLHRFTVITDAVPPSPAPSGSISVSGSTVTAVQASSPEAGATRKLERRTTGTTSDWAVVATDAAPAIGRTLVDSGVPEGSYEYEITDYDSSNNRTFTGQRWSGILVRSGSALSAPYRSVQILMNAKTYERTWIGRYGHRVAVRVEMGGDNKGFDLAGVTIETEEQEN